MHPFWPIFYTVTYPLSGESLLKSLLLSTGNSHTASGKFSGPMEQGHTIDGPFLLPFPLPEPKPFPLDDPPLAMSNAANFLLPLASIEAFI